MKKFYGPNNEILMESTFDMDRVVVFLPGISGKAHSERFAWLDGVADKADYACARVSLWDDEEAVQKMTIKEIFSRLDEVIDTLKGLGFEDITMVGKSFGGGVTLGYEHALITKKIMWAPAVTLAETDNLDQFLEIKLSEIEKVTDITINAARVAQSSAHIGIIHGTEDEVVSLKNSQAIVKAASRGELIVVDGAGHSFKDPQHERALQEATASLLQ